MTMGKGLEALFTYHLGAERSCVKWTGVVEFSIQSRGEQLPLLVYLQIGKDHCSVTKGLIENIRLGLTSPYIYIYIYIHTRVTALLQVDHRMVPFWVKEVEKGAVSRQQGSDLPIKSEYENWSSWVQHMLMPKLRQPNPQTHYCNKLCVEIIIPEMYWIPLHECPINYGFCTICGRWIVGLSVTLLHLDHI